MKSTLFQSLIAFLTNLLQEKLHYFQVHKRSNSFILYQKILFVAQISNYDKMLLCIKYFGRECKFFTLYSTKYGLTGFYRFNYIFKPF